jgi:hypothetical protein
MVVMGLPDTRIAAALGLTYAGLAQLKQRPEYRQVEQEILQGTITRWDEELAGDVVALRQEFAVAVPASMRTLLDAVMQKKDLKSSIEAAKEILDRDPDRTFSKNPVVTVQNGPTLSEAQLRSIGGESDKVASEATPVIPKEQVN